MPPSARFFRPAPALWSKPQTARRSPSTSHKRARPRQRERHVPRPPETARRSPSRSHKRARPRQRGRHVPQPPQTARRSPSRSHKKARLRQRGRRVPQPPQTTRRSASTSHKKARPRQRGRRWPRPPQCPPCGPRPTVTPPQLGQLQHQQEQALTHHAHCSQSSVAPVSNVAKSPDKRRRGPRKAPLQTSPSPQQRRKPLHHHAHRRLPVSRRVVRLRNPWLKRRSARKHS